MNYTKAIKKLLKQLNLPEGQNWVTLEDIKRAAVVLDDSKNRSNS